MQTFLIKTKLIEIINSKLDKVIICWILNVCIILSWKGKGGLCQPGTYCPQGTELPLECPPGSYQDEFGKVGCKDCPEGYYCYGNSSDYVGNNCPEGHYCPLNTTDPKEYKCGPGTYNNRTNQIDSSACISCDAGKFCSGHGNPKPTGLCQQGYYCPMGSTNATSVICPAGSFCPVASETPTPCTGGSYCDRTGLDTPTFECKEGYYCTLGASQANPTDGVTGNVCPKGNYCPRGSTVPQQCPIGTYLNTTENVYVFYYLLNH